MPKQKPNEQVQQIPLSEIRPFKNHPFKVTDDELMQQTIDSIMQVGVLNPAIIRPAPEGGYEMVAGHRRLHAADLAGLKTIPAIVRNLDDDEAVILMVDSNLQRETISPMERAQAYKMKLEALKHQGKRVDLEGKSTSRQLVGKLETADKVGELAGDSGRQVQRYIRLTELLPEVQKKVDSKEIAFSPAVELSYLTHDEQKQFLDAMDYSQNTPSLSQAQRLKKLSREGKCTKEAMRSIMSEEKKEEQERITLSSDTLRKYFPPKLHAPANAADHHQAAGAVAEKTAAPERALRKAGLSMNVTINIYGDVHIHCDCCNECGEYDDNFDDALEAPHEAVPDAEDGGEQIGPTAEEAEAAVKALAAFFLPLFSEETDEGGGAHEGI